MLHYVLKYYKLIFVWAVLGAVALDGVALFFPRHYSATSQVLVITRDRTGVDPYTLAKSAELIGQNLAGVMLTSDFYTKVMNQAGTTFNKSVWSGLNDRTQRRTWQDNVKPAMAYSSNLLKITAYATTQDEAAKFTSALTDTLTSHGWEYIGGDVILKVVDAPLVSRFPARPNFFLTTLAGLFLGALLGAVWVTYYKKHSIFG